MDVEKTEAARADAVKAAARADALRASLLSGQKMELPVVTCSNKYCPQDPVPPGTKCTTCGGYIFGS